MARTVSVPADGRAAPRGSKRVLALRGDDHLVAQVRRGSEAAFEVVYERHLPGILSFCRHMLGSLEEAEDAVQQAFAAAHRELVRDDRDIRLKPWLYAIARNRCLSMLRARREQPHEALEGSTEGLDAEVQQRAELRELVADLQDLPEDQRAALLLSELRDLSHADVAEALGCEVSNVKGLVFRARAGLIERRDARGVACEEIQEELATARGGALRRGRLRHHLRACSACSDYLEQVRAQRRMLALVLPVVPTLGLKKGVLAAVGIGGGASGGGGGAAAGGGLVAAALPAAGGTVAKVAVVGALVGSAGVASEAALDEEAPPPASRPALAPKGPAEPPRSPLALGAAPAQARERPPSARDGDETAAKGEEGRKSRARPGESKKGREKKPTPAPGAPPQLGQTMQKDAEAKAKAKGQGKAKAKVRKPLTERVPVRARPLEPPRAKPKLPPPRPPKAVREPKKIMVDPPPADRALPVPDAAGEAPAVPR